jgi:tetratricopeptide (TPR) repeat protein
MTLRTALFLLIVLCIPFVGLAESSSAKPEPYEVKLEQGIEYFYQTDWDKASSIFEELKTSDDSDPRAFFFHSMIPFWEYFFGGNSSEAAVRFMQRSEKAIEISSNRLKENPHDTTMVLMLSGLYGYRSLVAANEKNYRTAIQSGITGFRYTRQLLALDDEDPKALIGKGIFYYMAGTVPKELRWATNMMGIRGDKEEGLKILEKAATSNSYVSNDAKMILSYLYKKEKKYSLALQHIEDLCQRYEENIIFQFNYAEILEKSNRQKEAKRAYQAVVELQNPHLDSLNAQSRVKIRNL